MCKYRMVALSSVSLYQARLKQLFHRRESRRLSEEEILSYLVLVNGKIVLVRVDHS
jgi:hypothetical protein